MPIVDSNSILNQWTPEGKQYLKDIDDKRKIQHQVATTAAAAAASSKQFMRDWTNPNTKETTLKRGVGVSDNDLLDKKKATAGSRRRHRPSRKYKKSAKRVFRKKSRSTRRR